MIRFIKYTHPAAMGYDPMISYKLDDVLKSMKIEDIKVFFEPIDFKWQDLNAKSTTE
jgi:hypothetical protein